jgi:hypothetical protein
LFCFLFCFYYIVFVTYKRVAAYSVFGSGVLRQLTGGGMAIATPEPPPLGTQVIILVKEQQHGVEYVFPCKVVSRTLRGRVGMGVAFEGIPSQTRLGNKPSGVWRSEPPETNGNPAGKRKSAME